MTEASERTFVVAEAGVNHDGSLDQARRLVDVAAEAGADAVKFQTFRAEDLVTTGAPKTEYQQETTGREQSQQAMLRDLEVGPDEHEALRAHCREAGIMFLSSPFDVESARFLVDQLGLDTLKVPSGEITNGPLLLTLARLGTDLIVSTGMSTLGEVERALAVLAYGLVNDPGEGTPGARTFREAYECRSGRERLSERVTVLHCTSEYPAPEESVNLCAMDTLEQAFGLPTGLSDHTTGIAVPLAAAARGASVIEKHFTLDHDLPGPDHAASLEPGMLEAMVSGIRAIESAMGHGRKVPDPVETGNRHAVRKGLVARRAIEAGTTFEPEDLAAKRPAEGVSPMYYWEVVGSVAHRDYAPDDAIVEPIQLREA